MSSGTIIKSPAPSLSASPIGGDTAIHAWDCCDVEPTDRVLKVVCRVKYIGSCMRKSHALQ